MEKEVFFPLKSPKNLEKFQKIVVGHENVRCIAQNAGHTTQNDGRPTRNIGHNMYDNYHNFFIPFNPSLTHFLMLLIGCKMLADKQ